MLLGIQARRICLYKSSSYPRVWPFKNTHGLNEIWSSIALMPPSARLSCTRRALHNDMMRNLSIRKNEPLLGPCLHKEDSPYSTTPALSGWFMRLGREVNHISRQDIEGCREKTVELAETWSIKRTPKARPSALALKGAPSSEARAWH